MAAPTSWTGRTLGHYRVLEQIGAGGMGVVFRARDERLDRDVALKLLPQAAVGDAEARRRFHSEARALSRLNHPNIATVHDFDEQEGIAFLVMEYIAGESPEQRLEEGPLPEAEVLRLGIQLAEGLAAAHAQGIIHRDLKPGNLRLTPDGRLKILDFGLAKLIEPASPNAATLSQTQESLTGTLPYMAPEQLRGERADERTDIWAAGCVLYEVASGRRPFAGRTGPQVSAAILNEAPPPLGKEVPASLCAVIERCLAKDAGRRYPSATELQADLRSLAAGTPIVPYRLGGRAKLRQHPFVLAIAAVAALALIGIGVAGLRVWGPAGSATPTIDSVAVLPLKNLSGDAEQDYFVEGMHDALIMELSQISALKVISRTSAMRYERTDKRLPVIARELNVTGLIEGSVLREGGQVRITVKLIDARADRHLWSQSFDRELRSILALHSEVAREIAREIRVQVTPQEQARLARARPVDPEAHEAYLKARFYGAGAFKRELAIELFETALSIDPDYAEAHAGLAQLYAGLGSAETLGIAPAEVMLKAQKAALMALEIDSANVEAHIALGQVELFYEWDWEAAEKRLKRILAINPNSQEALHVHSHLLLAIGRQDEALRASLRLFELDPVGRQAYVHRAWHHLHTRQYQEVLKYGREGLKLHPQAQILHDYLARAYSHQGAHELALTHAHQAVELSQRNPHNLATLGFVYAAAGKKQEAVRVLQELHAAARQRYVAPFALIPILAGLGEQQEAFHRLEQAYVERNSWLLYMKLDARLDPLRGHPRFQALVRQMKFPE